MGNFSTRPIDDLLDAGVRIVDLKIVEHHVRNGGCEDAFRTAMWSCHQAKRSDADIEACVKATAALRRCFAGNPEMFKHQYLWHLDHGLDQDLNPPPGDAKRGREWRWWTGMRRS